MPTRTIVSLFAIIASVNAKCNGINVDEDEVSLPPGHCFGASLNGEGAGIKFECGSTPMVYLYDNGQCSGSAINSTVAPSDTYVCDGTDCNVVIVTIYANSSECIATDTYLTIPYATDGCIDNEDGTSVQQSCAGGTVTSVIYPNSDCSGDSAQKTEVSSGCIYDTYIEIECGAADKFLAVLVMMVVAACLSQ